MTTTRDTRPLDEVIKPALDAYGEALDAHGTVWGDNTARCRCGWEPRATMPSQNKTRSVGLHVSAARKRASKVVEAESERLMDEARKGGWR